MTLRSALLLLFIAALTACGSLASPTAGPTVPAAVRRAAGLGPVLQSKFGGPIYGWDMNQNGTDAILTESIPQSNNTLLSAIETFDQPSGQISKVVQKRYTNLLIEPVMDAVAGSDVGIVDVEREFVRSGQFVRDDHFDLIDPVSGGRITKRTALPHPLGVVTRYVTDNQASSSQLLTGYLDRDHNLTPIYFTYDAAHNAWGKRTTFPRAQLFSSEVPIYAAIDAATNQAVVGYLNRNGYSPEEAPTFDVLDASSGAIVRKFKGLGQGFINGMALDSSTGVFCTTTAGDMLVEFYKLATGKGLTAQIPHPYGGGGLTGGAAVAADPLNHLFLVAQLNSTLSPSGGSTVLVYNEKGKLVEYLNGFHFLFLNAVVVPRIAVNPAERTAYVNGPATSELQEFSY